MSTPNAPLISHKAPRIVTFPPASLSQPMKLPLSVPCAPKPPQIVDQLATVDHPPLHLIPAPLPFSISGKTTGALFLPDTRNCEVFHHAL